MNMTRRGVAAEPCASNVTVPGVAASIVTGRITQRAVYQQVLCDVDSSMLLVKEYVPGAAWMWVTDASRTAEMSSATVLT